MDPFEIIVQAQDEARQALIARREEDHDGSAGVPDELEAYLDLEERIVYPWLDRCGPDGSAAMADGMERHAAMLELLHQSAPQLDRLRGALDGHIEVTGSQVIPCLRRCLDATALDDLGDALEEARLSRTEATKPLNAPLDQPPADSTATPPADSICR